MPKPETPRRARSKRSLNRSFCGLQLTAANARAAPTPSPLSRSRLSPGPALLGTGEPSPSGPSVLEPWGLSLPPAPSPLWAQAFWLEQVWFPKLPSGALPPEAVFALKELGEGRVGAGGRGLRRRGRGRAGAGGGRCAAPASEGALFFAPSLTSKLHQDRSATLAVDVYVGWVVTRSPGLARDARTSRLLSHRRERPGTTVSGSAGCGRQAAGGRGALDGPRGGGSGHRHGAGIGRERAHRSSAGAQARKESRRPPRRWEPRRRAPRRPRARARAGPAEPSRGGAQPGRRPRAPCARRGRGWGLLASRPGRLLPPEGRPDSSPGSRTRLAGPPRRLVSPLPFLHVLRERGRRLRARIEVAGAWGGGGAQAALCFCRGVPGSEGPAGEALGWAVRRGLLAEVAFGALYPQGLAGAPVGPRSGATCPQIPFPQCPALYPAVPRPRPLSVSGDGNFFWER